MSYCSETLIKQLFPCKSAAERPISEMLKEWGSEFDLYPFRSPFPFQFFAKIKKTTLFHHGSLTLKKRRKMEQKVFLFFHADKNVLFS